MTNVLIGRIRNIQRIIQIVSVCSILKESDIQHVLHQRGFEIPKEFMGNIIVIYIICNALVIQQECIGINEITKVPVTRLTDRTQSVIPMVQEFAEFVIKCWLLLFSL